MNRKIFRVAVSSCPVGHSIPTVDRPFVTLTGSVLEFSLLLEADGLAIKRHGAGRFARCCWGPCARRCCAARRLAHLAELENDDREIGEVKWFNVNKGYGFITRDSGEDVFVHFRAIRGKGHRTLAEGQKVRYHVVENERGLQADDVTVIS